VCKATCVVLESLLVNWIEHDIYVVVLLNEFHRFDPSEAL